MVGADGEGRRLLSTFPREVDTRQVVRARHYRTPVKTRILAGGVHSAKQQVVRIDRIGATPITPATRAAVIEGLIQEDYVHRNAKELVPTPKASSLLFALSHFGATEITSPELTGDWEHKLKLMEGGRLRRGEFMDHIVQVTRDLVDRIREGDIPEEAYATVEAPCPKCGGVVQENYRKFQIGRAHV